jgi:hypothetical protein
MCKNWDDLSVKVRHREAKYVCKKCKKASPKEKWCCKPKKL